MIERISSFTSTIICTIMMLLMIKMIVPDGKSKKYILFLCGIITTIILIEPILEWMNVDVDEVLATNQVEYEEYKVDDSLYQEALKNTYEKNLIEDIILRLKENGYTVSNVKVEYDATYHPTKLYLDLEDNEGYVQPVKIEVSRQYSSSTVSELTKNNIRDIIHSYYGIAKNNIWIQGGKEK